MLARNSARGRACDSGAVLLDRDDAELMKLGLAGKPDLFDPVFAVVGANRHFLLPATRAVGLSPAPAPSGLLQSASLAKWADPPAFVLEKLFSGEPVEVSGSCSIDPSLTSSCIDS